MNALSRLGRLVPLALALSLALPVWPASAAQYDSEDEGWAPSRVGRLTVVTGDVSVRDAGTEEWGRAELNAPLFEGDEVYADRLARVEAVLGEGRFARFGDGADVTLSRLDESGARLDLTSGTLTLSLDRSGAAEPVEVAAPAASVIPQGAGVFRVDVADNGDTWVTVSRGSAEVATPNGSFDAIEGDLVSLSYEDPYDIDLLADAARYNQDSWDRWSADRDVYYAGLYRRQREFPPELASLFGRNDIYGLAELAAFGTWRQLSGGRWGWQPNDARRADWAPYQDGYWDYSPVAGWTWISSEQWGWAPYHYGRWDFDQQYGWTWTVRDRSDTMARTPRSTRYNWRPALVYMWQPQGSDYYAWVPLAPGDSYRNFGLPSVRASREPARVETAASLPRYLRERRGVVAISSAGLERRERPMRADRTPVARVLTAPAAQAPPTVAVQLPRPSRVVTPARAAAVRVRPAETVRRRAVVAVTPSATAPTVAAPATGTATAAPTTAATAPREVRRAQRQELKLERKAARSAAATTTEAGERPAPGKQRRGKGRNAGAAGTETQPSGTVSAPATVTTTPAPTTAPPATRRTPPRRQLDAPATQTPPADTTTTQPPADTTTTTQPPADTTTQAPTDQPEPKGKGKGRGLGRGKRKNQQAEPEPTEPAPDTTPPPGSNPP